MNAPSPNPLARHVADLLESLATQPSVFLQRAVAELFAALEERGTCIRLDSVGDPQAVEADLRASGVAGEAGEHRPLVIEPPLLYAQRYHACECAVADRLGGFLARETAPPAGLEADFAAAFRRGVTFITGGPGTGKTTLVARVLEGLAEGAEALGVGLMAPTGKAAARLSQTVGAGLPPGVAARLRLSPGTVHRLLGANGAGGFRHNASNPLPHPVVVLDEASMIDLPLMAALLDAIDPAYTRLLVVGDPDQLPAVQAGSVLGDISVAARAAPQESPLRRAFVRLTRNWRSAGSESLSAFVHALQEGDDDDALAIAQAGGDVSLAPVPAAAHLSDLVSRTVVPPFAGLPEDADPATALAALDTFRLLCALRQGPFGSDALNGLATEAARVEGGAGRARPLIITRNDPPTGLANGDTGIVLTRDGRTSAWFSAPVAPRNLPLQRLPHHEPAYALTVHRSQGSEFEDVAVLFPPEDHPLLTRELVYTAASRARKRLTLHTTPEILRAALSRRAQRTSGLAGRLK